ncbi:unnamed protein product, partial [Polarella glacialis]
MAPNQGAAPVAMAQEGTVVMQRQLKRRTAAAGRVLAATTFAALAVTYAVLSPSRSEHRRIAAARAESEDGFETGVRLASDDFEEDFPVSAVMPRAGSGSGGVSPAFLSMDEKDGRFCGKEG